MVFSSSWILPLKVFFISTGVLSIGLFFKTSVPFIMDFTVSRAPTVWSSFLSWLKPPYLYLIINGIIVTIVVSSRFYPSNDVSTESSSSSSSSSSLSQPWPDVDYEMKVKSDFGGVVYEQQPRDVDVDYEMKVKSDFDSVVQEQEQTQEVEEIKAPFFQEKSIVVSDGAMEVGYEDATWTPPKRTDSSEILTEYGLLEAKPLVSTRFGHRKPIKAGRLSPAGGKALGVTKPKQHETLESTWKTITEGRAMPWTRHLKKSDTWENHGRHVNVDPSPVKKSETFQDRSNHQLPPVNNSPARTGKLRKEPSLSQDELNRRVEAFIKKFNDEMRLQREESLRQYQEMIGRGV